MSERLLARRYATALVELCDEAKNHAVVKKQLESFQELLSEAKELDALLLDESVAFQGKKEVLGKIFARLLFAPVTRQFILVLLENGRWPYFAMVKAEFDALLEEKTGRIRGSISSAEPLAPSLVSSIQSELSRLTGKQVILTAHVDESLLGGVVTRLGDVVLDDSIKSQLEGLKERLSSSF